MLLRQPFAVRHKQPFVPAVAAHAAQQFVRCKTVVTQDRYVLERADSGQDLVFFKRHALHMRGKIGGVRAGTRVHIRGNVACKDDLAALCGEGFQNVQRALA